MGSRDALAPPVGRTIDETAGGPGRGAGDPQRSPVLRFAPSPNGYLHAGHAYSALLNERLARQLGGALLLRIENIDVVRCRPDLEAAMLEDLDWLGVQFDGAPRRQSAHLDVYAAYIRRLADAGLTYPCFCSRTDIAAAASAAGETRRVPDGALFYPGNCRCLDQGQVRAKMQAGRPFALRLHMARAVQAAGNGLTMQRFHLAQFTQGREAASLPEPQCSPKTGCSHEPVSRLNPAGLKYEAALVDPLAWGDAIIARKETPTSYHVSVVVDDALQGVTHVVRGQDLEAATAIHRVLQSLWGLSAPAYLHHDLICDEAGGKLAKSLGSKPLRQLRAEGMSPQILRASLGFGAQVIFEQSGPCLA